MPTYSALHLIRQSLPVTASVNIRKLLYITLVCSHLSYCSQLWKPRYVKDILCLEKIQRRATNYILNDYYTGYKSRLQTPHLLPVALWLDLHDPLFLVKCLQDNDNNIGICQYISFRNTRTRTGLSGKMLTINCTHSSAVRHFYFNRIATLWNTANSVINLSDQFPTIKHKLINFLWDHFLNNFDPTNTCSYHLVCPCSDCHTSTCFAM